MEQYIHSDLRKELHLEQTEEEKELADKLRKQEKSHRESDFLHSRISAKELNYVRNDFFSEQEARQLVNKQQLSGHEEKDRDTYKETLEDLRDMAVLRETPESIRLKQSTQTHDISQKALAMRNHIVRKMKLDSVTKQKLIQSGKSLHYVVDTFTSQKFKNSSAKFAVHRLEDFRKIKDTLKKDPLLSPVEKARMLYNMTKSYALSIATYKETYVDGLKDSKRKREIISLIDRYYALIQFFEGGAQDKKLLGEMGLMDESAHKKLFGDNENVLTLVRKQACFLDQKEGEQEQEVKSEEQLAQEAKELDEGLTYEQGRGLRAVDAYLANLATENEDKLPFIGKILSLSGRERLFVYQALERKGCLTSPKVSDAAVSQFGYIPNFKKIQDSLSRSTYRVWEIIKPDHLMDIHWDKMEAALALVKDPAIAEVIRSSAALTRDRSEEVTREMEKKEDQTLPKEETDAKVEKINATARKVFELEKDRDKALQQAYQKMVDCQEAVEARDAAWFTTRWYKKKIADQKVQEAITAMDLLRSADLRVSMAIDSTFEAAQENITEAQKKEALEAKADSTYEKEKSKVAKDLMFASAQTTSLLSKVSLVPKLYSTKIGTIGTVQGLGATVNIGQFHNVNLEGLLTNINITAGALGTATGVIGAVGALGSVIETFRVVRNTDIAGLDKAFSIASTSKSVFGAATAIGIGVTNIKFANKVAQTMMAAETWKTAVGHMKLGVQIAGATVAGAGLALDAFDLAVQIKHEYHRSNALDEFELVKNQLTDTKEDKKKALYLNNIDKLDKRNKERKFVGTMFSIASNSISLAAATTSSAGVGLFLAGASLLTTLSGKVTEYIMRSYSQKKSVREFLNLEDLSWLTDSGVQLFTGMKQPTTEKEREAYEKEKKKLTSDMKESMLNHMAAELGFATFAGMYKHIVGNYASFVYNNLFKDANGDPIYDGPGRDHMVQGCYEFVRGLGLKVKYPPAPKEGDDPYTPEQLLKLRHPSQASIAKKLGG